MLSFKESYLLLRNSLGLVIHPFKTLRALLRERDYSQILLIIGAPFYILCVGLGLIWFGRRLIDAPRGVWGFYTKGGVLMTMFVSLLLFTYLGYWAWQVWKVRRK